MKTQIALVLVLNTFAGCTSRKQSQLMGEQVDINKAQDVAVIADVIVGFSVESENSNVEDESRQQVEKEAGWSRACREWKLSIAAEISARRVKEVQVDCGRPSSQKDNKDLAGIIVSSSGSVVIRTDQFRGQIVQIETFVSIDSSDLFSLVADYQAKAIDPWKKACEEWKNELSAKHGPEKLVFATCGTFGSAPGESIRMRGKRFQDLVHVVPANSGVKWGSRATALIAIDN